MGEESKPKRSTSRRILRELRKLERETSGQFEQLKVRTDLLDKRLDRLYAKSRTMRTIERVIALALLASLGAFKMSDKLPAFTEKAAQASSGQK